MSDDPEPCARCGQSCVELPTDYGPGHTAWVPNGDWDNYDPCSDDEGRVVPHAPAYEPEPNPDRRDLWERRIP